MEIGILLMVLVVGLQALVQTHRDPRIDADFRRRSWLAVALFFLYVGSGLAILLLLLPGVTSEAAAGLATAFFLFWTCYGGVWLIRWAPRLKTPPAWLLRPWGWPDRLLLAVTLACLLGAGLA